MEQNSDDVCADEIPSGSTIHANLQFRAGRHGPYASPGTDSNLVYKACQLVVVDISPSPGPRLPHYCERSNMELFGRVWKLAGDTRQLSWVVPLLFLADVALCSLILWRVPCMLRRTGMCGPI